ncbi:MAG TPA: hypothetical protein VGR14_23420 [Verrucomicrobiae bacterium]|jgi:hypothetical protein|nr:hypothetical protein [Verrucomicrobiae bacterium]
MRNRFVKTTALSLFLAGLLVGCFSYLGGEPLSASIYIIELDKDGKLPGIVKDEHITTTSIQESFFDVHSRSNSVIIKVEPKDRKDVLLWYYVVTINRGASWKLTGARQSDAAATSSIDLLQNSN